jgi:hypothetical protein
MMQLGRDGPFPHGQKRRFDEATVTGSTIDALRQPIGSKRPRVESHSALQAASQDAEDEEAQVALWRLNQATNWLRSFFPDWMRGKKLELAQGELDIFSIE